MSRKKWYGILLILEAILYLVSYGSSLVESYNAQNLNGDIPLITTSSIFSIWNGMIICWVIWRIMKQRLNVEGLIAVLLLSIIQLLMLVLPSFSPTNLMNISFLLNIICLIWICLLIKNVEMRELLNNWKSKDSWKSSIAYLVLFVASTNISPLFILIGMDRTSDIYAFTLRYIVMELMFLLLINVMITSTSEKLQKVFSLLLILSSLVEIGAVYSFITRISFYGLFYLLLSIYIACRVFGLFEKVADSWESKVKVQDLSSIETKSEMENSQVEGEIDVNDLLNADIRSNNDEENSPKRIILQSPWLWSALIIAVCHLGIMIFPLFLGNPMYLLILYIGAIHYICFMIATILLFIGMRKGSKGLLNAAAILFVISIIGTPDPYWMGPNILSFILGVLVFIGTILFKNGDGLK
ncbi:ABC transporter permease [Streptococcus parasanguinis]|uniref:ABC transporter permease n=1 Tax=Streptococcus parasanguinis TaxID=1318 RepID=UPI00191491E8|nr:ABC transporter permease [Streptococcus parasanguinis]MBK5058571.1 ABC transporter permease [Streptococcus parasanguinis]